MNMAPSTSNEQTVNGMKLYYKAKSLLGRVLGADNAADQYGAFACAESVNRVAFFAFGVEIGGGVSTAGMLEALENKDRFMEVTDALPGDICMCSTGTSRFGPNLHGHVGIVGNTWNMSNDSETGTWEANYTREMWEASFAARGFKTRYFRAL